MIQITRVFEMNTDSATERFCFTTDQEYTKKNTEYQLVEYIAIVAKDNRISIKFFNSDEIFSYPLSHFCIVGTIVPDKIEEPTVEEPTIVSVPRIITPN